MALIDWLLKAQTPSIRYFTLVDLLDTPLDDARVIRERQAIMNEGAVPAILARQTTAGHWENENSYYTPKYVSTHWSMLLLTEFGIDHSDQRFQRGVDFMLDTTAAQIHDRLAANNMGWSCLWGNILHYAEYANKGDDPRVEKLIEYAVRDIGNGYCRCRSNGWNACSWGVVRTLWGLAYTTQHQDIIEQAIGFLLNSFSLIDANYPTTDDGQIHPLWFKLNFPLFYQVDILFTLRVLADLNALHHPGAQAALDWLVQQRDNEGRWHGVSPYRSRTWRELRGREMREETNRWVSLHAAKVLKKAGRLAS